MIDSTHIFHYTSLDAFFNILNSYSIEKPSLTFWASNCAFMNDPKEIKEGINLMKNSIVGFECPIVEQELTKLLENEHLYDLLVQMSIKTHKGGVPYAISFSLNDDNLNMWKMYGDDCCGILLRFDRAIIENKFENKLRDCYYYNPQENNELRSCFEIKQKIC